MEKVEVENLFVETEKVIAAYKEKVEKIDQQERELNAELYALQDEMTANILDQESASISEQIYLKIQAKDINKKVEIINVLLEELAEERTVLKLEFVPLYQKAIQLDRKIVSEYEATSIVNKYRVLMLLEIADLGNQIQSQYWSIAPDIHEIYRDSAVTEKYPRLAYAFSDETYKPSFSWFEKSVVSKDEVFSATRGVLPQDVRKQKDVK